MSDAPLIHGYYPHGRVDIEELDACWLWKGAQSSYGYGIISVGSGRYRHAHAVTFEWFYGKLPAGFQVHHLCANRLCVNPFHLAAEDIVAHAVLHGELRRATTTHCRHGHPWAENAGWRNVVDRNRKTYRRRYCLECNRNRNRRWLRQKRGIAS